MKIKPEQLQQTLSNNAAPIYLIGGSEALLLQEACHTIKQWAETQSYSQREVIDVDAKFNWDAWLQDANSLSLFSHKRYFELRLPEKLNKNIRDAISQYANNPIPDTLLVITSPKLDSRSAWVKTIEQVGVVVQIWPITRDYLPRWLQQRLQQNKLKVSQEGIQLLAEHVENNLLAAQQAIMKLKLIYGEGVLSPQQIASCLGNDAKYDIFQWVDTVLTGDTARSLNMLRELQASGTEPILMLWALAKDIRQLVKLSFAVSQGHTLAQVMQQASIWPKRKPLLQKALARHTHQQWQQYLAKASELDQIIKGAKGGNYWQGLERLSLQLCAKDML